MRRARSLVLAAALVLGAIVWWTQQGNQPTSPGDEPTAVYTTVSRVIDGHTFIVDTSTRIRVLGIDTPEEERDGQGAECGALAATAAARKMLEGRDVVLTPDQSQGDSDAYGRLLRYVQLDDGRDLAHVLLSAGHATVYTPAGAIARQDTYEAAERAARTQIGEPQC